MYQPLNAVPRLTIYNKIFQYIPANFIQVAHAKTSFINTKSLIEIALNSLNLEQYNIIVHYLVLHSSDQCQPLDIGLFDPMKRYDVNYQSKLGISAQSNQILKTYFFFIMYVQ